MKPKSSMKECEVGGGGGALRGPGVNQHLGKDNKKLQRQKSAVSDYKEELTQDDNHVEAKNFKGKHITEKRELILLTSL